MQNTGENSKKREKIDKNIANNNILTEKDDIERKITTGLEISLECDFCGGPVFGKPKVLKFADIERFFCCSSCKSGYGEKYRGRIDSIKRKFEGKSEMEF
jgi:hypothetical protein